MYTHGQPFPKTHPRTETFLADEGFSFNRLGFPNAIIVTCKRCGFQRADTFMACCEAATIHLDHCTRAAYKKDKVL